MNLPRLENQELKGKRVLVRADLDVAEGEDYRLKALIPTLELLNQKGAQIILMGHRGRPNGVRDENLSLKGLAPVLSKIIGKQVTFIDIFDSKFSETGPLDNEAIFLLENLRFEAGEEANNPEFAKKLAENGDFFVNDAFASSHREHASIVSLPKLLPHAAGVRFNQEVENLSRVFENPKRPVVFLISGLKEDKLSYIEPLETFCDKILLAGRLPDYLGDEHQLRKDPKVMVGDLIADKEDITLSTVEKFKKEIEKAGTIVVAGPMGKYEDEGHRQGTKAVFEIVANCSAFKVAGGGDSVAAINLLRLAEKFDWISVGGGAMLEFLAKGTLPGIQALLG
jgi:phosphoglycerate kinase